MHVKELGESAEFLPKMEATVEELMSHYQVRSGSNSTPLQLLYFLLAQVRVTNSQQLETLSFDVAQQPP